LGEGWLWKEREGTVGRKGLLRENEMEREVNGIKISMHS
jgi:hypothetical protein